MTENKSDVKFAVGIVLAISPAVFFLGNLFALGIASLVAVSIGTVVTVFGTFTMAHAHEHAKSLQPCGRLYKN